MRVAVIGLGVQGAKRQLVAGSDVVATVDPVAPSATHRNVREVPADAYDAALVCVPEEAKLELLKLLLSKGKHVLVEKPLMESASDLRTLADLAAKNRAVCYTAYNHRFEPHIARLRELLRSGELGRVYSVRLFYGNGTARNVRESVWRDGGSGVLRDLGSHLLDLARFLFEYEDMRFDLVSAQRFENRAYDHAVAVRRGDPLIQIEMTFLSWRNQFSCDVLAENGSAHIDSLCKWGTATFTHRRRVLPSGRPIETSVVLDEPDPTWALEYEHFKTMTKAPTTALQNDLWINETIERLAVEPAGKA